MKTPDFWYRQNGVLSLLLMPFGQVYRAAGIARRALAKPYRASIPIVCVGNVVAGGAGKTPVALALAELLKKEGANPAFVTRGYGGAEKGVLRVDVEKHDFERVGDEAILLAKTAPCWVGRDRAAAIREAEKHATHIIMDDGLQNPFVAHTTGILVIDGAAGLGNGRLMPAGPLRETLTDVLPRIDAVVLVGKDHHDILSKAKFPQVIRAEIKTSLPERFPQNARYFAFAGIGRPEKFYSSCVKAGLDLAGTKKFPDHHRFSKKDLSELTRMAEKHGARLITTEKDFVRLPEDFRAHVSILPIKLSFGDEKNILTSIFGTK